MRKISFTCLICGEQFVNKQAHRNRSPKFCSRKCYAKSLIGKEPNDNQLKALRSGQPWNKGRKGIGGWKWSEKSKAQSRLQRKGRKLSENHKANISKTMTGKFIGENGLNWKGDKVGYIGLHLWIYKELGSPMQCEWCSKTKKNNREIHWANISGFYTRVRADWVRLCVSCHKRFDKTHKTGKLNQEIDDMIDIHKPFSERKYELATKLCEGMKIKIRQSDQKKWSEVSKNEIQ